MLRNENFGVEEMGWTTPIKLKSNADINFYNIISRADRIHRYPAKMTPKLAHHFLRRVCDNSHKADEQVVLDLFCGSGTTLLVAGTLGFRIAGCDLLEVPTHITRAKLFRLKRCATEPLHQGLALSVEDIHNLNDLDEWEYRDLWFDDDVYRSLMGIRSWVYQFRNHPAHSHLLTALSQVVWDVSAADPNIIVPTRSKRSPKAPQIPSEIVLEKFKERLLRIHQAQKCLSQLDFPFTAPRICVGDAKDPTTWPIQEFDYIITSPPYGDGIDYRRAVSLQTRFFDMEGPNEERSIRERIIGRKSKLIGADKISVLPKQEQEADWVRKVKSKSNDRLSSLLSYVDDMNKVFEAIYHFINCRGRMGVVLGNPEVSGIRIPLARVICRLAEELGWSLVRKPEYDLIKNRYQTPIRRSSLDPIPEEFLLEFKPNK